MATHSSILAWRIPGTGEPGGLPSMGSHRVRHDWSDLAADNPGQTPLLKILDLITYFVIQIYIHGFWRLGIEYILEEGMHFSTYHIQPLRNTDLGGPQPAWQPD